MINKKSVNNKNNGTTFLIIVFIAIISVIVYKIDNPKGLHTIKKHRVMPDTDSIFFNLMPSFLW